MEEYGELGRLLAAAAEALDENDVGAGVSALGQLYDPRALPGILRHAAYPSPDVRMAVAAALPGCMGAGAENDAGHAALIDAALSTLIALARDEDADVRDWATFGLGSQLDVDTSAVREALADRLDDPEGDIAGEALVGLARRRDPRALPRILAWLDGEPGNLIVEAAEELAAPECLPALLRLKERGWQAEVPSDVAKLHDAIAACSGA